MGRKYFVGNLFAKKIIGINVETPAIPLAVFKLENASFYYSWDKPKSSW